MNRSMARKLADLLDRVAGMLSVADANVLGIVGDATVTDDDQDDVEDKQARIEALAEFLGEEADRHSDRVDYRSNWRRKLNDITENSFSALRARDFLGAIKLWAGREVNDTSRLARSLDAALDYFAPNDDLVADMIRDEDTTWGNGNRWSEYLSSDSDFGRNDILLAEDSSDFEEHVGTYVLNVSDFLAPSNIEKFKELADGLDDDDLDAVARLVNGFDGPLGYGVKWDPVSGELDFFGKDEFYRVIKSWSFRDLAEFLDEQVEEDRSKTGGKESDHLKKIAVKKLPQGLSADQLALLRMFELKGVDKIPSQDLRKLPMAQTPYVKNLLDQYKVLTPDVVMKSQPPKSEFFQKLQKHQQLKVVQYTMKWQRLWQGEANWAFVVALPFADFSSVFGIEAPEDVRSYMNDTTHPSAGSDTFTIGWVRFTDFEVNYGWDIWIDEIQTDISDKIGDFDLTEHLGGNVYTAISRYVLEQFIREMRARGVAQFYLPTIDHKQSKEYGYADPPQSVYTDLPKKFRFSQVRFGDTPISRLEKVGNIVSRDQPVWVLAKRRA